MLRRTALRAALAAAKPTPSVVVPKSRTFVSLNQSKLRPARQWTASCMQRRFASEDATITEKPTEQISEESATENAAVESATRKPAEVVEEVVAEAGVTSKF